MAFVNYSTREINVKIVYYGAGLSGKTANLQHLYSRAPSQTRGRLISLATESERTLFFDFLPMNLGTLRGFKVRFHLYTVPGQVFYEASRKLILKGADGVLFVVDSDPLRFDANVEAWEGLRRNLLTYDLSIPPLPAVIQYNKRDLPGALPLEELRDSLGRPELREFESIAVNGTGVFESLKALARAVLHTLQTRPLRSGTSGFIPDPPRVVSATPGSGTVVAPPGGSARDGRARSPSAESPGLKTGPAPQQADERSSQGALPGTVARPAAHPREASGCAERLGNSRVVAEPTSEHSRTSPGPYPPSARADRAG